MTALASCVTVIFFDVTTVFMVNSAILCAILWFACSLTVAGLFLAYINRPSAPEYDASGVGHCLHTSNTITVTNYTSFVWAQSPRAPTLAVPLETLDFTGENAIVMRGADHFLTTVVGTPRNGEPFTLRSEREVDGTYVCSFTLDSVFAYQGCWQSFQYCGSA